MTQSEAIIHALLLCGESTKTMVTSMRLADEHALLHGGTLNTEQRYAKQAEFLLKLSIQIQEVVKAGCPPVTLKNNPN